MLNLVRSGLGWAILAGHKIFRGHRGRPSGRKGGYRLRGEIDMAHNRVRASRAQGGPPARLTPAGLVLIVPPPGKCFLRMEKIRRRHAVRSGAFVHGTSVCTGVTRTGLGWRFG